MYRALPGNPTLPYPGPSLMLCQVACSVTVGITREQGLMLCPKPNYISYHVLWESIGPDALPGTLSCHTMEHESPTRYIMLYYWPQLHVGSNWHCGYLIMPKLGP